MNRWVIYRYELKLGEQEIILPEGSRVVSFDNQYGHPVMWVLQPVGEQGKRNHGFYVAMTGEELEFFPNDEILFYGTAQFKDGAFILHLLERKPK